MFKKIILCFAALAAVSLTACNTVQGAGKDIEAFQPGPIVVEAEIWRTASETREAARTITWAFGVA